MAEPKADLELELEPEPEPEPTDLAEPEAEITVLLLPDPVTAVEPEPEPEPEPELTVHKPDALAGPMAEFGTVEVLRWLETVQGLTESELVAIKAKLVEEEFIGRDLLDLTDAPGGVKAISPWDRLADVAIAN